MPNPLSDEELNGYRQTIAVIHGEPEANMMERLIATVDALKQELEQHRWRSIDSAPKDTAFSGDILLFNGSIVFIGYQNLQGRWVNAFWHSKPADKPPTHWKPIDTPGGES